MKKILQKKIKQYKMQKNSIKRRIQKMLKRTTIGTVERERERERESYSLVIRKKNNKNKKIGILYLYEDTG